MITKVAYGSVMKDLGHGTIDFGPFQIPAALIEIIEPVKVIVQFDEPQDQDNRWFWELVELGVTLDDAEAG